jgi:tetratricopeptide (TPR) repeat protein
MGKLVRMLKMQYNIEVTESNFIDQILRFFDDAKLIRDYFSKYYQKNKDVLGFNWGVQMIFFILSNIDEDMESLERSYFKLLSYPENSYINNSMAFFYGRYLGDFFKAKKFALKAAELNEENPDIYYELGYIYNLLGIIEKSQENYNKAIFYASKSTSYDELMARSYFNLAVHEYHLENDIYARELVDKALKIIPDYHQALQLSSVLFASNIDETNIKSTFKSLMKMVRR